MVNLREKLFISLKALGYLLRKPVFIVVTLAVAVTLFIVFRFFFSGDILFGILFSQSLTLLDKLSYITIGFIPSSVSEFLTMFSDGFVLTLLFLAIVQGIAVATYVWITRKNIQRRDETNLHSIGLALFGSGCVACGSSIIAPLFAGFSATTATFFIQLIGNIFLLAALFVAVYGLYKILLIAAMVRSRTEYA